MELKLKEVNVDKSGRFIEIEIDHTSCGLNLRP